MGTVNPRVAGYIPPNIHNLFKSFKEERGIKGDSQALAVLMSEFFKVPHSVAQRVDYSSFVTQEQFDELASKVSELAERIEKDSSVSGRLSKLPDEMGQIAERLEKVETAATLFPTTESKPMVEATDLVPGQMDFLTGMAGGLLSGVENKLAPEEGDISSSSEGELKPKTEAELAERFGMRNPKSIANQRRLTRDNPDDFAQWSKKKDPQGVPWEYNPKTKLYDKIANHSPVTQGDSPL